MAEEAYYLDGSRNQQGPVPIAEIGRLIRGGTVRRDTLVWYPGMPDWRPASQVTELASFFSGAAPPPRPPAGPPPLQASPSASAPMQRRAPIAGAYPGPGPQAQAARPSGSGGSMGFGGAIATCFRKYVDFTGRARRAEYWWFMLFYTLLLVGLSFVDVMMINAGTGAGILSSLASLALFLPTLAVAVRRLHDTDRTGWWVLIGLIPLIGWIIYLVFVCQRGTEGPNRFGPDPLGLDVAATFE